MLTPFGPDIWIAEGPQIVAAAGFHYPTRMVVIRLGNSGLLLWSPVAMSADLRRAVDDLGQVAHLVAPNHLHHMALTDWARAYPEAQLHAAPGLRAKRTDLSFDHDLGSAPHADWSDEVDQVVVHGNRITTEVVFFHRASGTVIFADLLQQLPKTWFSGWRALVARLDLMTEAEPQVPRKFRLAFTDRAAARQAVTAILNWPATSLVMAHGASVTDDAPAVLRRAFSRLIR